MYLCIMVDASWEISEPISLLTISHHGWPLRHIWHHFENHHGKLVQLQVPQVPLWSEVESTFCSQPEAAPLGRFWWIWEVWMVGVLEVSSCGRDGIGTRLWRNQPSHPHWQRPRRSRLGCVLRTDLRGCSRWIHGLQVGAGRSAAVHQVLGDYCKQILHDGQKKMMEKTMESHLNGGFKQWIPASFRFSQWWNRDWNDWRYSLLWSTKGSDNVFKFACCLFGFLQLSNFSFISVLGKMTLPSVMWHDNDLFET